ncbi:hypothetical protein D3C71_1690020 [compost metagenome]
MGFGRHQQSESVVAIDRIFVEATGLVTGDRQVITLRDELVCQLYGRHAFRAVAGAGERDQQQWMRRAQIIHRVGHQIGGRNSTKIFPGVARKPRGDNVADKCRCSRTRQHDPQIVFL